MRNPMPLSTFLKSAAGTCPFCNQKAGILSREHPDCRRTYQAGWDEMVHLAAQAAASPKFDEKSLRLSLAEIARRSYGDDDTINQALEAGWKQGVSHAMADGIVSQPEEARLREFRDRLALDATTADQKATTLLERASTDRLTLDARLDQRQLVLPVGDDYFCRSHMVIIRYRRCRIGYGSASL